MRTTTTLQANRASDAKRRRDNRCEAQEREVPRARATPDLAPRAGAPVFGREPSFVARRLARSEVITAISGGREERFRSRCVLGPSARSNAAPIH